MVQDMAVVTRRVCIFCGGAPCNKEHVIRRAWRARFPDVGWGSRVQELGGQKRVIPEHFFDLTVRRVCEDCNSGWMNALDTAVESWLFRFPGVIGNPTSDQLPVVTRWAIKTAIMRGLVDDDNQELPREEYEAVARGDVPDTWNVFIGKTTLPDPLHAHIYGSPHSADLEVLRGEDSFASFRVTSWSIGGAVFIVSRDGWLPISETLRGMAKPLGGALAEVTAGERMSAALIPAWKVPELFWVGTPLPEVDDEGNYLP